MATNRTDDKLDKSFETNGLLMRLPAMQKPGTTSTPNSSPPDFDFNFEFFKSSFARSLSLNSASIHHNRQMEFDRNGGLNGANGVEERQDEGEGACGPPLPRRRLNNNDNNDNGIAPAIPARRPMTIVADVHEQQLRQQVPQREQIWNDVRHGQQRRLNGYINTNNDNINNINNNNSTMNGCNGNNHCHHKHCTKNNWPRVNGEQIHNLNDEAKENDDSRYMVSLPIDCGACASGPGDRTRARLPTPMNASTSSSAFDVIDRVLLLQIEIKTLQWQLKQAESGLNMHRVVSQDMLHFIDRFREYAKARKLEKNKEQITRSRSVYQDNGCDTSSSYLRTRSSTNLHLSELPSTSAQAAAARTSPTETAAAAHNSTIASPSHTPFTDYTWRRCKKRDQPNNDIVEEQLDEEAFRLLRTIGNLLHTQQPDLTQHRNSVSFLDRTISTIGANSLSSVSMNLNISTPTSTSNNGILDFDNSPNAATAAVLGNTATAAAPLTSTTANPLTAELLYLRNIHESRCSVRSSTDSSVHSTSSAASSSSKVETDEDPLVSLAGTQRRPVCSSTEGESGFSSITSLQDVGIPLSSTLINDHSFESRNSTLRAIQPSELSEALNSSSATDSAVDNLSSRASHPNNVVGLPLLPTHAQNMQYRSKTHRQATRNQRFSTVSNDDASAVLWV